MHRSWYRSRLLWFGLFGFIFILWAWASPILSRKGTYLDARWITPGNFFLGCGLSLDFHRMQLWAGRPRSGAWGAYRHSGFTFRKYPLEFLRDFRSSKERVTTGYKWGNQSFDSVTITIDYRFIAPIYLVAWTAAMILWQGRKRRLYKMLEPAIRDPTTDR